MGDSSILLKDVDMVMTMNPEREILKNVSILINGGKIIKIGNCKTFKTNSVQTIDGRGMVALPGFINAHAHGISILARGGLAPDRRLRDWLINVTHPIYVGCTDQEMVSALEAFACECIKSGITTVVEMEGYQNEESSKLLIETFQRMGLRLVYAPMVQDLSLPPEIKKLEKIFKFNSEINSKNSEHHHHRNLDAEEIIRSVEQLISKYHGSYHDMVRICPAASNIYEISGHTLRRILKLVEKYNTLFTIHVAESELESKKEGLSGVDYLATIGCLNHRMILAHCVQVNERDIRLIKETGARIVHNPAANAYLGSGIAPVHKFILAGIPVGIGLDNPNCNDGINMLADLRLAALLQKGFNKDPACITAEKVLEMATIEGANVLNFQHKIGSIELGKDADIILVDINHLHLQPVYHLPSVLVYQTKGYEVDTVIVAGRLLLRNGKLVNLNEQQISENLCRISQKVVDKMNLVPLIKKSRGK
jgi:cytosine/adenosine deaminase-related metal-dependent hydrolase